VGPIPRGAAIMNREAMSALLVYNRPDPLEELKQVLESQGVRASVARSCGEAALRLWSERPPDVVFTDTQLGDGTWADVLKVAASAQAPTNAIVVSRCVDVRFYLETIERGSHRRGLRGATRRSGYRAAPQNPGAHGPRLIGFVFC
jgi:response regulator RpfG family c-di-GMP phosphodiesterase